MHPHFAHRSSLIRSFFLPRHTSTQSTTTMTTFSACRQRIMQQVLSKEPTLPRIPIHPVTSLEGVSGAGTAAANWARVNTFKAKPGEVLAVPDSSLERVERVILGLGEAKAAADAIWAYAALPGKLPAGTYSLDAAAPHPDQALLGWCLGMCAHMCGTASLAVHRTAAAGLARGAAMLVCVPRGLPVLAACRMDDARS